jgi:hypothetical protein
MKCFTRVALAFRMGMAALLIVATSQFSFADQVIDFYFDDNGFHTGLPYPPIIGIGELTLPTPQADGTYYLSSLTGFSMLFDFGVISWTDADLIDSAHSQVVIYNGGTAAYFTDDGTGTPYDGGAMNLITDGYLLSFSPSVFLPDTQYVIVDTNDYDNILAVGSYGSSVVPEPSSLALLGLGGLGLIASGLRRRTTISL